MMFTIRPGVCLGIAVVLIVGSPLGAAASTDSRGAELVGEIAVSGQRADITVYSPSMDRNVPLQVLRPSDTASPAPTLYLLNGAGGGEDSATWTAQTDAAEFFEDKHVNVVTPMEGAFSYYTDWQQPDDGLAENSGNNGVNKWTTFLTKELPPVIDREFSTTGENALAGISMAGSAVLDLAVSAPELYRSVGAFSGCAATSSGVGQEFVKLVVAMGGGDAENMWGSPEGGEWTAHDPIVNADQLPRIPMYISTSSGLPGRHDSLSNPRVKDSPVTLASQMVVGGVIEAATQYCTAKLADRTNALGMNDIRYNFKPAGTHSWGYWEDDLHDAWPMFADSLGL